MNILNAIPMSITLIICCCMSYWHGNSEHGMRKAGLTYTIILGTVSMIVLIAQPIFL